MATEPMDPPLSTPPSRAPPAPGAEHDRVLVPRLLASLVLVIWAIVDSSGVRRAPFLRCERSFGSPAWSPGGLSSDSSERSLRSSTWRDPQAIELGRLLTA